MTAQQYVDILKTQYKNKEMMLGKVVEIELAAAQNGGGINGMNRPQTQALIREMRRLIHEYVEETPPASSRKPQVGEGREDWADMEMPEPTEDDMLEREQRYNAAVRRNEQSGRQPKRRY